MRFHKVFVLVIVIIICFAFSTAATSENAINFGNKPDNWMIIRDRINSNFIEHLAISLEDGYVLLYEDLKIPMLYLSIIKNGEEKTLWQGRDLGAISALVPRPILATMKINSNDSVDLIFIYSTNLGIGNPSRTWKRELLIFFDSGSIPKRIKLSSEDVRIDDTKMPFKYYCMDGRGPAYVIRNEIFIKPFLKDSENIIYLWSRISEFGGAKNMRKKRNEKLIIYSTDDKRSSAKRIENDKKAIDSMLKELNKGDWIKLE